MEILKKKDRLVLTFAAILGAVFAANGQTATIPSTQSSPVNGLRSTPAELALKIRDRVTRPEVRRGQIGIKVVSLNSGTVVYEENAEKYFIPASNMKNFTVATALEKLSPDYRFVTSVYAFARPDGSGIVNGPLRVFGRGDISISYGFNDGDYFKGIDRLADAIVQAGVKRVEGDLMGDETYFSGSRIPATWEWDDLQWYYGAEVSALPINDNAVVLSVMPGPVGYGCSARLAPVNLIFRVINHCTTTAAGSVRTLKIEKKLDQNIIEITGTLPFGNPGFSGNITVSRPAEMFVSILKQRLELKGVTVTGQARSVDTKALIQPVVSVEIARLESPPLALIAAKTMKPSQNMYTETLLWALGEDARSKSADGGSNNKTSAELGIEVVKDFLKSIGIAEDAVLQTDGSGMSRHDLVTPAAVAQLYMYMAKSKYSQTWRDSLTIGGVDGTLRNRFAGTKAAGNVRGKTGTVQQVSALSGYITTAGGEQLVFSMIVNGVPEARMRTALIDDVVLYLADFDGKLGQ